MNLQVDDALLDEDLRKIHEIVDLRLQWANQSDRLPPQIQPGFDVEFNEDWNGEFGFYIWLHVENVRPPRDDLALLVELTSAIQRELTGAGLRHWTYVGVRPGV